MFSPRAIRFEEKPDPAAAGAPDLQKRIDTLEATLTSVSAQLRTLAKPKADPVAVDTDPPSSKERIEKLERTLKERDAAELESRRMSVITGAISEHGIADVAAEDLFAHVIIKHGKNIKAKGESFVYEDPESGESMPVKDFLEKKILVGARKDRYAASTNKKGASADRGKGGSSGNEKPFYSQLSPDARAKMSDSERAAYLKEDSQRGK